MVVTCVLVTSLYSNHVTTVAAVEAGASLPVTPEDKNSLQDTIDDLVRLAKEEEDEMVVEEP